MYKQANISHIVIKVKVNKKTIRVGLKEEMMLIQMLVGIPSSPNLDKSLRAINNFIINLVQRKRIDKFYHL